MNARKLSDRYRSGPIVWTADGSVPGLEGTTLRYGELVEVPAKDGGGLAVRFAPVEWNGKRTCPVARLAGRPRLQALVDEVERAEAAKADEERRRARELAALPDSAYIEGVQAEVGATVRRKDGSFVTVVGYGRRKVWDDFEDEWVTRHVAGCRPATDAERAACEARIAERERAKGAAAELARIAGEIRAAGEYPAPGPDGKLAPEGETVPIGAGQTIYGGGEWLVVGPEWIWHVMNNGSDGGDWSLNNVRTGGAGAIGRRVPFDAELARKIRELAEVKGAI